MSVALHLVLAAGFLIDLQGAERGGGAGGGENGEGGAIVVTLAGRDAAAVEASRQAAADQRMSNLLARAVEDGPQPLRVHTDQTHADLQGLMDQLKNARSTAKRQGQAEYSSASSGQPARADKIAVSALAGSNASPSPGRPSGDSGAQGDLWSQIEPCWRRMPDTSTVPVTLDVSLDSGGRLAGPPRVVEARGGPGQSSAQAIAINRAVHALAACLPYKLSSNGTSRGLFRVSFGTSG